MEKKDLRKQISQMIKNLDGEEKIENSKRVCKMILELDAYADCDFVFSYVATENELDPIFFNKISASQKKLFLPKTHPFGNGMDFYMMDDDYERQLAPGRYGIKEPDDSCQKLEIHDGCLAGKKILMVVPGLGFSKNKNRLGHGMGFYDIYIDGLKKILSQNGGQIFLLGICFPCQMSDGVDNLCEDHDQKMDMVLY